MKVKTGFTALSVAVVASLALAACGGSSSSESSSSEAAPASSAAAPASSAAAPASSAAVATAAWVSPVEATLGDAPVYGEAANSVNADGSVNIDVGLDAPIVVTGPPKVALFASGLNNTFGQAYTKAAQDTAAAMGVELEAFDGNNDPATQLTQLQNAIASGKYNSFIVVPVDSKGTCKLLTEEAPAAGIVVEILTTSMCDTDTASDPELWVPGTLAYVGGLGCAKDQITRWANQIAANTTGPQVVGLLTGPDFQTCTDNWVNASKAVIEEQGWKLAQVFNGEYTQDSGYKGAQTILNADPTVTTFWSNYSENTLGALKALEAADRTDVTLFDIGALGGIIDPIKAGKVVFSKALYPNYSGAAAMNLLAMAFMGEPTPRVVSNDGVPETDADFVSKANVDSFTPGY